MPQLYERSICCTCPPNTKCGDKTSLYCCLHNVLAICLFIQVVIGIFVLVFSYSELSVSLTCYLAWNCALLTIIISLIKACVLYVSAKFYSYTIAMYVLYILSSGACFYIMVLHQLNLNNIYVGQGNSSLCFAESPNYSSLFWLIFGISITFCFSILFILVTGIVKCVSKCKNKSQNEIQQLQTRISNLEERELELAQVLDNIPDAQIVIVSDDEESSDSDTQTVGGEESSDTDDVHPPTDVIISETIEENA